MESNPRNYPPVLDPRLRRLLVLLLLLFGLLSVNSVYLGSISLLENTRGVSLQDGFYLSMFLLHLALGLLLILPFLLFASLHLRRARHRPNRYAIRAGLGLFGAGLALLFSGLVLIRFGWFEINDPQWRNLAYWFHVLSPLAVAWLFVVHRLAGPPLRWRSGAYWGGAALFCSAITLAIPLLEQDRTAPERALPYAPALAQVAGSESRIPARHLMQDAVCAECHADIAHQASMGMHRFSSFNNPAYRFSIDEARAELLARDGTVVGTRLCAVCHDQVPLFSGRFDDPDYAPDPDPGAQAGITCVGCHAITTIDSPRGNGAYTLQDPPRYPFAFSDTPILRAINRQLIKAKPAFHKATFLKPLHHSAEFCSVCHKVHLPYELNHYKWLRGQNHYDSFLLSGVSGHRVDSFYYPPRAAPNCAHCHMPLVRSEDPAARDFARQGEPSVHDHLFAAANTGVPHLLGLPEWSQQARYRFLQSLARVDIFALRQGKDIDGELLAPLRPQLPALQAGQHYLLELVVRNLGVGHQLTQGTTDSNELWLDVVVRDAGRVVGRSGALDGSGAVDPWAYFVNSYLLDRQGKRIERRNAQDIFVALYDHQIPPGAASTVHYGLTLPADAEGPIEIEVKLQYRKFDTRFLRHVQGDRFKGNELPIVTLAEDRLSLPLQGHPSQVSPQRREIPEWQRWNDYGIGLLLKGKHELRQAEQAFNQVERLEPAQGALNLARVHFLEGRLDDTSADLQRAAAAHAPPWTLAWYAARVAREYGELDQAITNLQGLVETRFAEAIERGFDFSKDYRVLNELGRSLYERARQERGAAHQAQRAAYLSRAKEWLHKALVIDPENLSAHYNLALVFSELGDTQAAAEHRRLHEQYRPDDQAIEQAVSAHRRANPAADHAAEPTAIYLLEPPLTAADRTAQDSR
ncbi:MAG: tetratricopeptide repeat protein [Chromatiales bacterium]